MLEAINTELFVASVTELKPFLLNLFSPTATMTNGANEAKMQTISFQPFIQFNAVVGGIKPASTEAEYQHLISLMQDLTDQFNPDDPQIMALFDILAQYISTWETNNISLPTGTPADVLRHLMSVHGVSQTDLEQAGIASQSQISNILANRRAISRTLAERLAKRFAVPLESFLGQ
jgi:HTH-type transcriptional regulator / antitoxin HigA